MSVEFYSSIASFAGLGVTIWLLIVNKNLRRFIERHFGAQMLSDKLTEVAERLRNFLESFDDRAPGLREELNRCHANLSSLKRKSPRRERRRVKEAMRKIEKHWQSESVDVDFIDDLLGDLAWIQENVQNWRYDTYSEAKQ